MYCTRFTNKIINEKRRYPKREEEAKRTAGLKREETGATLLHGGELKFFVAEGGLELLVIDISYHNPIIKKAGRKKKESVGGIKRSSCPDAAQFYFDETGFTRRYAYDDTEYKCTLMEAFTRRFSWDAVSRYPFRVSWQRYISYEADRRNIKLTVS